MTTESQLRSVLLDLVSGTKGFAAIPVTGATGSSANPTIAAYTTSDTPNQWSEALIFNSDRKILFIQNPPTNSANIDIGFGSSGSESLAAVLEPGSPFIAVTVPITSRISLRSSVASASVIVWEA